MREPKIVAQNNDSIIEFALKIELDDGRVEYVLFNLDDMYKGIDGLANLSV